MDDDPAPVAPAEEALTKKPRSFLPALLQSALTSRLERATGLARRLPKDGALEALALTAIARAERLLERLEGTAEVLDKVARTELSILEKLEPIVDDLGRLVRLQLAEARQRLGVRSGSAGSEPPTTDASSKTNPRVIDVE